MAYKIEMKHPDFPADTEFDLGGVAIKNGSTKTLTEVEEQRLVAFHGTFAKDALSGNPNLKVSGTSELSKKEVEAMTGGES